MSTIKTVSNKANREIELTSPNILDAEDMKTIVKTVGEAVAINLIKAQLTIAFRSKVRTLLEATDDNGDFVNSDEAIIAMTDLADWKPEPRTRKTAEEKAEEALGALPPEVRAAILAKYKK